MPYLLKMQGPRFLQTNRAVTRTLLILSYRKSEFSSSSLSVFSAEIVVVTAGVVVSSAEASAAFTVRTVLTSPGFFLYIALRLREAIPDGEVKSAL